jgi:hypothetical protein
MICTIINYCTNDYRFLGKCLAEARKFSSSVIVPVCTHFFDGLPEDREMLERTYAEFPDCRFLEYSWDVKRLYTPFLTIPEDEQERICLWHSTSRYVAAHYLPPETEYILFLDADEIPEGKRFAKWLETGEYRQYDALWFHSHMYRFSASERLEGLQYAPLMVRKSAVEPSSILNSKERFGTLLRVPGVHWLKGVVDRPFFHHYSWVRSRQECFSKVRTWAKRKQSNWEERLETAWQKGEFLEEGVYERVEPYFDPLVIELPVGPFKRKTHEVERIDPQSLFMQQMGAMLATD